MENKWILIKEKDFLEMEKALEELSNMIKELVSNSGKEEALEIKKENGIFYFN